MEEVTTTRKIDKNTVEITKTTTQVEVSTYVIDDLYGQMKKIEQEKNDFISAKDSEMEKLKQIISEAESLEITPIDIATKPAK